MAILDGRDGPYASEFLFIGTEHGVYAFDRNTGTWGRFTTANGLPGNRVHRLGLDDGILWVATDSGLASADVRVGDWQTYELEGAIAGLGFDPDYAWAAGDRGVFRFDKFTEAWERVLDVRVNAMVHDGEYLWLTTDSTILRYQLEYERLERMPVPGLRYGSIVSTPGRHWFFGTGGWGEDRSVAYDRKAVRWSEYEMSSPGDTAAIGDTLLSAHLGPVRRYDPRADNWQVIAELQDVSAHGIRADAKRLLLATDGSGLMVYEWAERRRTWYTTANGLVSDSLHDAYEDGDYLYAIGPDAIQYLDKETGIWQVERIEPPAQKREALFCLDDAGAHARLVRDVDVRLAGRAYYSETRNFDSDTMTSTDYENINLNLVATHETGRALSAYYDDSDKDQKLYGFGYRGRDEDLLFRANGGFLETEWYEFDLVPRFSTFGANTRLRWRGQGLNLQGGRLQSRPQNDFFTGRTVDQALTRRDVDYGKRVFYYIHDAERPVARGADTVFVDDRNPGSDTVWTRKGATHAGIRGDWDVLANGRDYFIDYTRGFIHFLSARRDTENIVLKLNGDEIVIQSDSVEPRMLENVYSLGRNMVPGTFRLAVRDTLGAGYALSEFGLDRDGDGQVDPEFIDHDLGYLVFPAARPFPDAVYEQGRSVYAMDAAYRTRSTLYVLSSRPILKGSETVRVDGEVMERAGDYIIDYTSGNLVFLREDVITDFSEVEVQYSSVERERASRYYSAQPNLAVADGINVAPGFSVVDSEKVVHVSGRLEKSLGERRSVRYVPQAAVAEDRSWAQAHALTANYGIASLSAEYRGYTDGFEGFGTTERKYGTLRHGGSVSAAIEPLEHVRVDGGYKRDQQLDSTGQRPGTRHLQGRVSYLNPALPNGSVLVGQDRLPEDSRTRLKADVGYEFGVMGAKLKLGSVVQNVDVLTAADRQRVFEYIVDANFRLPVPVRGDIYFRHNDLSREDAKEKAEQELRTRLNFDAVPGLYYTGNYELEATGYEAGSSRDLRLVQQFYNNLHFAPGRWWQGFSVVNMSLGTGSNFDQYGRRPAQGLGLPVLVFEPVEDVTVSSITRLSSWYGTLQFAPVTELLVWLRHARTLSGTGWYGVPVVRPTVDDEVKVEYEPARLGKLTGSWKRKNTRAYPEETTQNLYLEWSMPWSQRLRTKLTGNYYAERDDYDVAVLGSDEARVRAEALVWFGSKSFATFGLAGSRAQDHVGAVGYAMMPGAGVNLNLLRFLYLQLDGEADLPLGGEWSFELSSRATVQF